jgi:predicted acyl esterase
VLNFLSKQPFSNGKVGMFGLSWSAFNALMIATRNPAALGGLFVAHGSEDLFYNDIQYINGVRHFDDYMYAVSHSNTMPAPPLYTFDDAWAHNRLRATPWAIVALQHQRPGPFWQKESVRMRYNTLRVPLHLTSGLFDAYRDFSLNICENAVNAPSCEVVVGPFLHNYAHSSSTGGSYDDLAEAVRFFKQCLQPPGATATAVEEGAEPQPRLQQPRRTFNLTTFVIDSYTPFVDNDYDMGFTETIPGRYVSMEWPPPPASEGKKTAFYFAEGGRLTDRHSHPLGTTTASSVGLVLDVKTGTKMGNWFGNLKPDQKINAGDGDGDETTFFETVPLVESLTMVGFPIVKIMARPRNKEDGGGSRFVFLLQDVHPNGTVTHVTGQAINTAFRDGLDADPAGALPADEWTTLETRLRFSAYDFPAGHQIRIVVANSLWRMLHPSMEPHGAVTDFALNRPNCFLELPVLQPEHTSPPPSHVFQPFDWARDYVTPEGISYFEAGGSPAHYFEVTPTGGTTATQESAVVMMSNSYKDVQGSLILQSHGYEMKVGSSSEEGARAAGTGASAMTNSPPNSSWKTYYYTLIVPNYNTTAKAETHKLPPTRAKKAAAATATAPLMLWDFFEGLNGPMLHGFPSPPDGSPVVAIRGSDVPNLDLSAVVGGWTLLEQDFSVLTNATHFMAHVSHSLLRSTDDASSVVFEEFHVIPRDFQ